jgi:hypothetical protein
MHQSKALIELIRDMLFLKIFKVIQIGYVTKNKIVYTFVIQSIHGIHRLHSKFVNAQKRKMYTFVY